MNSKFKILLTIFLAGILLSLGIAVFSQICGKKDIEFDVYKKGIYVVSIDAKYFADNSDIYVPETLETVEEAAEKNYAKVAINAGFFDPNNGKTISYILKNNNIIENPENNERLTQSEELKPYLEKIYNRSEFRNMSCWCPTGLQELKFGGCDKYAKIKKIPQWSEIPTQSPVWAFVHTEFDIKQHKESLEEYPDMEKCALTYSIQAGPELVPNFDLEDEFFVFKKDKKVMRESASALHKTARSAIGIKNDRILLVAVSNQNPMTLEKLSDFMKSLGVEKAMAFDGGSSTSLYVNTYSYSRAGNYLPEEKLILNSAKDDSARRVKSVLIVK